MIKKITCIECPQGCQLEVNVEEGRVIGLAGNKCPKGEVYGRQEIEDPRRILSSTVVAAGLDLKLVPVRTDRPVPKSRIFEIMGEVHKLRIDRPVGPGDIVQKNLLGLGVDLVATRGAMGL